MESTRGSQYQRQMDKGARNKESNKETTNETTNSIQ